TPTQTPIPKPSATPKPTEIIRPPYVVLHTPFKDINTDLSATPYTYDTMAQQFGDQLGALKDRAGVVKYYELVFPPGSPDSVYTKAIIENKPAGLGVQQFDREGYFFKPDRAYFTNETRNDRARVFVIEFKAFNDSSVEVNAQLRMVTNQKVLSKVPIIGWSYFQVPGGHTDPGMIRWPNAQGQSDEVGVTRVDVVQYWLNQATQANPNVTIHGDLYPEMELITNF
ncbi:MAG: hypothetical protein KGJ80_13495, partial [Chloroflexota bacterium]|nr:hypothetical protein [Chloroflexota bacterium]